MGIFDQVKQAMQMRSEAKRMQSEIEKIQVEYANGGISVTARGDFTISAIKISPEAWAEASGGKPERFETIPCPAIVPLANENKIEKILELR